MNWTKASRSSSLQMPSACRIKVGVSATVMNPPTSRHYYTPMTSNFKHNVKACG